VASHFIIYFVLYTTKEKSTAVSHVCLRFVTVKSI